jgi:hypothetical protein
MIRNAAQFLTLALRLLLPTACECQNGLRLFHEMQTALGGREKINAVRAFEQCVRANTWNNAGKYHGVVYKRTRWIKPNIVRLDQIGMGDTYVLFFDGKAGWEILPDKGFAKLAGEELDFAQGYAQGVDVMVWLADDDADMVFTSSASNVVSLSTKGNGSHRTDITLDPRTFLPMSESTISLTDARHPLETKRRQFGEWGDFQGVKFPRRIINFHRGARVADIRMLQIKINGEMSVKDLAIEPQDKQPQMFTCPGQ